jgi:hypothetical protein
MANRETAIRTAYYQALNGNLSYNSVNVPITDSIIPQGVSDSPIYCVFDRQFSTFNYKDGAFSMQSWTSTIDILIISKQSTSVSKEIIDGIADQIESIITPSVTTNGLPAQSGWQITNVFLDKTLFMPTQISGTQTIIQKGLTFTQKVVKQS